MEKKAACLSTLISLFFLLSLLAISPPVSAITITVNSNADTVADDGSCTLREAITTAVSDNPSGAMVGECPDPPSLSDDEIVFDMNLVASPIVLGSELPGMLSTTVDIIGPGADQLTIQGNGANRILPISGSTTNISGLTFTQGYLPSGQGSVLNIQQSSVTVSDCVVKDNNSSPMNNTSGGAFSVAGSDVTVLNSTFSDNHAGLHGGAIFVNGFSLSATLNVKNSTFKGNTAAGSGGAIHGNGEFSNITLVNVTVAENQANTSDGAFSGGGLYDDNDMGSISVQNSIIADNTSGSAMNPNNCDGNGGTGISSDGHNIESEIDCGFNNTGDLQDTDPLLAPLGNYGGTTETMALLPGSPAVDTGDDNAGDQGDICMDTDIGGMDQRALPRCVDADGDGNTVDIGAYEMQAFTVNSLGQETDVPAGDGACDNGGGVCSLAGARNEIAALGNSLGPIAINFNVTGTLASPTGPVAYPFIESVAIYGPGPEDLIIPGENTRKVFSFNANPNSTFLVSGVTVSGGLATAGQGAGITINSNERLFLKNCAILNNQATTLASGRGGGLQVAAGAEAHIEGCTFSGNTSHRGGGAINLDGNAVLTVKNSTINNNHTIEETPGDNRPGGGIWFGGTNVVNMENTTISGNSTTGNGGGLFISGSTSFNLNNLTITNNTANSNGDATGNGGGIYNLTDGIVFLRNSILAGNSANGNSGNDCNTKIDSLGYNLVQDTGNCTINTSSNDITGQDPLLAALADNGGATQTHAPASNSPAVDAGNPAGCKGIDDEDLSTDQRGFDREVDGDGNASMICDMGAHERGTCGDGAVDDGEECDDGAGNSDSNPDACRTTCENFSCGDGVQDTGESCDDGNNIDGDGCQANCALPTCGDGIVDAGEQCDDGNGNNSDACINTCMNATCGDSFTRTGVEECDDGPANSNANPDACRTDCTNPVCGDGVTDMGETCDDGNTVDGDGCSAACQSETPPTGGTTPTGGTPTGAGSGGGGCALAKGNSAQGSLWLSLGLITLLLSLRGIRGSGHF